MSVEKPTLSQLQDIVFDLGMELSEERLGLFHAMMDGAVESNSVIDALPDSLCV